VAIVTWQAVRPKARPLRWAFRVTVDAGVVFESAWVAVRYATRADAAWLAATIDRLAAVGRFAGCLNHPGQCAPVLRGENSVPITVRR
jgi:hypothetical protein